MATLSDSTIEALLRPYLELPLKAPLENRSPAFLTASQAEPSRLIPALSTYLDLLLRWNERTNLTSIRDPEQIVCRHFGESLLAARVLASRLGDGSAVLDIGSGAGFPGLPIQLALPGLRVTLAESQGKKSAFLREAVRVTGSAAEVWAGRSQELQAERRFHAVTMRAVDRPEQAAAEAGKRLLPGGYLLHLCAATQGKAEIIPLPGLATGVIEITRAESAAS